MGMRLTIYSLSALEVHLSLLMRPCTCVLAHYKISASHSLPHVHIIVVGVDRLRNICNAYREVVKV